MKKKQLPNHDHGTIVELLRQAGSDRAEQLLFVQECKDGVRINYRRFEQDLLAAAGKIRELQAQHIGVVCDLTYPCIVCLYAIMVAGKVVVPLEADQTGETLDGYVDRADIELLLYNEDRIDGTVSRCEALLIPDFLSRPGVALSQWPAWEEDRNACIFFTSGTEGKPNGVVLTQKNMSFINSYASANNLGRNARVLLYLPIHHVFSFLVLTSCIHDGCEIHLSKSIKYVSRELVEVKPDALVTVPMVNELFRSMITKGIEASGKAEQIAKLIKFSNTLRKIGLDLRTPLFRNLRENLGGIPQLLITGGSAASEDTMGFFDDIGIIILQAYGMTETSGSITTNLLEQNRYGSVGHCHPFNQVRIKDDEIQVRGENIMKEYYKDPRATADSFDDGWFRTGDLGYFDGDGYLFITGRKKNLIILDSGENVSPEELENRLLQCEAIGEIVVSERQGHIHAEIYGNPASNLDVESLRNAIQAAVDSLNRQNPVYKRIVSWELRNTPFEKTASLKIRR
jgi:long-chain acyl-CoA synthetase